MTCKATLFAISMVLAGSQAGSAIAQEESEIDCGNPVTQADMNICAGRDFEAADAELNAAWKKVKAAMAETDRDLRETSPELVGAVDALLKGQRGWIDYRDGQCETYGFEARGGTMESMLVSGCMAELTRARSKELLSLIDHSGQ